MCLYVKGLRLTFSDKEILRGINAKFEKGLNIIFGDSGSGKSTLLKALCFLLKFDGELSFKGNMVDERWAKKHCKLIKQSGFYTEDTIIDTVKKPFEFKYNRHISFDEKRFLELFNFFGLGKFNINDKVEKLSGGELQRLALIRALLLEPEVLLADEPTSNLDEGMSVKVYEFLKEFCKNRVCVAVSHEKYSKDFADRVYHLESGVLNG